MKRPLLSIVVPTFQRQPRVLESIAALTKLDGVDLVELIVVDQTDPPLTRSMEASGFHSIRFLSLTRPNVSAARNLGALAATAPILLFLDDDMRLATDYLRRLIEIFAEPRPGAVAGVMLDGLEQPTVQSPAQSVEWLPTGNLAVRRDVFLGCGGFDENIFRFNEDAEFSHRLRVAGHSLTLQPSLRTTHEHEPVGGTWTRHSIFRKAVIVTKNDFYFIHVTPVGPLGVRRTSIAIRRGLRALASAASGNGKLTGGSMLTRLACLAVAAPIGIGYALRRKRLIGP